MNQTEKTQSFEGSLREFLFDIEDFLSINSAYYTRDLKVIYVQEPQKILTGYVARGLIEVHNHIFSFRMKYDADSDTIELRSKAFVYYLSSSDLQQFLEYERNEGEE